MYKRQPLVILSVFSLGLGGVLARNDLFVTWLEPVTGHAGHGEPVLPAVAIMGATLGLVVVGAGLAWWMYARRQVPETAPPAPALVEAARRDMYQDAVNEAVAMRLGQGLVAAATASDRRVVDGAVRVLARGTAGLGWLTSLTESGYCLLYTSPSPRD